MTDCNAVYFLWGVATLALPLLVIHGVLCILDARNEP